MRSEGSIPKEKQGQNIFLIAQFELYKLFGHRRGVLTLVAFVLTWYLLLFYPIKEAASYLVNPDVKLLLKQLTGANNFDQFLAWPVAELSVYWVIALYLFSVFNFLLCADLIASDKQRGTLRFFLLRTSRFQFYLGRFIGSMIIQILMISVTVLATVLLTISRDPALIEPAISSGLLIIVNITLILLPYTALMMIFSLVANSARQATLYAVLFYTLTAVISFTLKVYFPEFNLFDYLVPGNQVTQMVNMLPLEALSLSWLPLLQTIILIAGGYYLFKRGDL